MEKRALSKYERTSAFKAREVLRLIQKKPVQEALGLIHCIPRKTARIVEKVLRSAIANAENDMSNPVSEDVLFVKSAIAGEGPTMKRWRPRARGHASRIRKRTSHITIVVSDQQ